MSKQYNLSTTEDNGQSVTTSQTVTEHPEEILRLMKLAGLENAQVVAEDEAVFEPTEANDKLDLDDYSKKSPESIAKQKKSIQPTLGDNPLEYSLDENEIYEAMIEEFKELEESHGYLSDCCGAPADDEMDENNQAMCSNCKDYSSFSPMEESIKEGDESLYDDWHDMCFNVDAEKGISVVFDMKNMPEKRFHVTTSDSGEAGNPGHDHVFVSIDSGMSDHDGDDHLELEDVKNNMTGAALTAQVDGKVKILKTIGSFKNWDDVLPPEPRDPDLWKYPDEDLVDSVSIDEDDDEEGQSRMRELAGIKELEEAQSPAQKAAFAKMLAAKNGKKDEAVEETEEVTEEKVEETTVEENLEKAQEEIDELKEEELKEGCGCGHGSDCNCGPECDCGCNAVTEAVEEVVETEVAVADEDQSRLKDLINYQN